MIDTELPEKVSRVIKKIFENISREEKQLLKDEGIEIQFRVLSKEGMIVKNGHTPSNS